MHSAQVPPAEFQEIFSIFDQDGSGYVRCTAARVQDAGRSWCTSRCSRWLVVYLMVFKVVCGVLSLLSGSSWCTSAFFLYNSRWFVVCLRMSYL